MYLVDQIYFIFMCICDSEGHGDHRKHDSTDLLERGLDARDQVPEREPLEELVDREHGQENDQGVEVACLFFTKLKN